jgi:hypothetical protein
VCFTDNVQVSDSVTFERNVYRGCFVSHFIYGPACLRSGAAGAALPARKLSSTGLNVQVAITGISRHHSDCSRATTYS